MAVKTLDNLRNREAAEARVGMRLEDFLFEHIATDTYQQIADELGVSICTVRNWMQALRLSKTLQPTKLA